MPDACCRSDKLLAVMALLRLGSVRRKVLVFVNSIDSGYRLRLFLEAFGIRSAVLNSELPLNSRHHILQASFGVLGALPSSGVQEQLPPHPGGKAFPSRCLVAAAVGGKHDALTHHIILSHLLTLGILLSTQVGVCSIGEEASQGQCCMLGPASHNRRGCLPDLGFQLRCQC